MEFPSAKDLDVTSEDMDNCPPGTTLSIMPPCKEYMADPMWFDQIGRDPIRARKIFRRWDAGDLTRDQLRAELDGVMEQWPRYGPAVVDQAAKQGMLDVVELLIDMGVEIDPRSMKNNLKDSTESATPPPNKKTRTRESADDDEPLYEPEHPYLTAIIKGHLDVVKVLVEKGHVPVDYMDKDDGLLHIAFAVSGQHTEVLRWLLDHNATVTLEREGTKLGDIAATIRSGKLENLKMLLAYPQVVDAGFKITPDHIYWAAFSGDAEVTRFVLQSECFGIENPDVGLAGQGQVNLTDQQRQAIIGALSPATNRGALDCVKLLLKQLTPVRGDATFEPLLFTDGQRTAIFNDTDDALDREDNSELFEILWDAVLHQDPSQESIDDRVALPARECLRRRLISTAAMGRVKTVKLLIEKYGVEVNMVSHKFFSTPLGRAAGSGANPLSGRLEVIDYLCSRPDLDLGLSCGQFCNGETALALSVQEASFGGRKNPELTWVPRLLLNYGGPVDEITNGLRQRVDSAAPQDIIEVHVLWAKEERRKPVILTHRSREGCIDVVLEYSARDLRDVLRKIEIRSGDESLKANDPGARPLMPQEGEEIPAEERAKPMLLQADTQIRDT